MLFANSACGGLQRAIAVLPGRCFALTHDVRRKDAHAWWLLSSSNQTGSNVTPQTVRHWPWPYEEERDKQSNHFSLLLAQEDRVFFLYENRATIWVSYEEKRSSKDSFSRQLDLLRISGYKSKCWTKGCMTWTRNSNPPRCCSFMKSTNRERWATTTTQHEFATNPSRARG